MQARGTVSRVVELRTMLRLESGRAQLIELLSADAAYPLYGAVALQPAGTLADTLAQREGQWGAAVDAAALPGYLRQVLRLWSLAAARIASPDLWHTPAALLAMAAGTISMMPNSAVS